ncbi:MAG: hypothetical protein ACI8WW_002496, partial [Oceanospirillaceae bacterium]
MRVLSNKNISVMEANIINQSPDSVLNPGIIFKSTFRFISQMVRNNTKIGSIC